MLKQLIGAQERKNTTLIPISILEMKFSMFIKIMF